MLFSTTSRRRLGALATACLLSVALPTTAAWAQKTKTKGAPVAESSAVSTSSEFAVDIPSIEAVDSNVDDATLRAILGGDLVGNAEALAGLTATSITIPTITLDASTTVDDDTTNAKITFTDLVLADVTDGVAATVTLGGMTLNADDEGAGEFGALTASNLDIGGLLGMYGLVDGGGQTALETIYTDFSFEGGTITSPEADCTIGAATAAEFKARPLNYSFSDIVALGQALETQEDDPSPELIGKAMRMYVDLLTAFETSEVKFDGFDCSGVDDEGTAISISIAGMTMGGMRPGLYPSISMDGMDITMDEDGSMSLGNVTFKGMDLSGPIAAIQAAPEAVDESWFMANARALIPAFNGFSFSDFAMDVPDPEDATTRIKASVGAFDLTLGEYVNGIPTDLLTTASNILVDLPEDSDDEQVKQLIELGLATIDAGFTVDASWDATNDTIAVDEISVNGANLATVVLAGTIANATEALFSLDENEMMMAGMGVAIANLKLDVTDAGLSDIILARISADQGVDAATLRPVYAGLAEGTIISMLVGVAEASKLGTAVSSFVSGKAKQLVIELTAKEAPGIGLADFMMAEDDPTVLIGKVTIDATAK